MSTVARFLPVEAPRRGPSPAGQRNLPEQIRPPAVEEGDSSTTKVHHVAIKMPGSTTTRRPTRCTVIARAHVRS